MDIWGAACDPKHCSQCNPAYKKFDELNNKTKKENKSTQTKFQFLIETLPEFTVQCKKFELQKYLRWGYEVTDEITITFKKSENCIGTVENLRGTCLTVFHNGDIQLFENRMRETLLFPIFNKYTFGKPKNPDLDSINHIKFIMQDEIFEDFVHHGWGIIINNSEIYNIYNEQKVDH